MESGKEVIRRRRYSRQLKEAVLAQCEQGGASVARVAMEHGINANVVHSWRKRVRCGDVAHRAVHEQFVALSLPAGVVREAATVVEVEIQRGATQLKVRWPLDGAADLARWTREVLR